MQKTPDETLKKHSSIILFNERREKPELCAIQIDQIQRKPLHIQKKMALA